MRNGLKDRRHLLFILSSSALIAYLAILIYSNHNFQEQLAGSLKQQFTMQSQNAAGVVRNFLDVRKFEMDDLLASRELTAYFENKALGMSELYGLKQSLSLVHERLLKLMDRRQATGEALYRRIALYDAEGGVLTDTSPESSAAVPPEQSGFPVESRIDDISQKIIYTRGNEILLVTPSAFKGRSNGAIVAWLNSDTLLALVERQMGASGMEWGLVVRMPDGYRPIGREQSVKNGADWVAGGDEIERGAHLAGYSTTMMLSPIPETPFDLKSLIPSAPTFGWNFPTTNTYGVSALAILVLLGLLGFLCVNEKTVAMTVRLEETEKSSEQMREKNIRLYEEVENRKEAEQQLAANEKLLASVITGAQAGIWDWNIQTGETRFNERWAEMIGYRLHDLEPLSIAKWGQMFHDDDRERSNHLLTQLLGGSLKLYESEVRMRHALGHWVWVLIRGMVIEWDEEGKPLRASGTQIDVSERKQAEVATMESEQRLQAILDAMPDSVVLVDGDQTILWANQRCFAAYGTAILGKKSWEVCLDRDSASEMSFSSREDGKWAVYEQEVVGTDLSGAQRVVLHMAAVVSWNEEGVPDRLVEIFRDVTDKKSLEGQLRQMQKMEAVGRLAGGVAHDFNNMLGVILGYADMALDQVDPTQRIHADLEEIRKAAERSADLTRQLLAFARKQTVLPKVLDLNEVVVGMLRMLERLIGERIDLNWMPGTKLWPVRMDPSQLDQILANLCVNARDAIADVGRISIETRNCVLDKEYCFGHPGALSGDYLLLSVSDNGCGMDKETLSHLFEPFFTTKGVGRGTGLGLATVYGAVKQNNGFIDVRSEPGNGTTITVYLPRYVGGTEQAGRDVASKTLLRGQETVLLVEDEPAFLQLVKSTLERLGYTVLAASTPGEAIRIAGEHGGEIALLFTDVIMPEMNGRELAGNLLSLRPNLKCLFMSGYSAEVIGRDGVLEEDVQLIQKPFATPFLAAKLREVLEMQSTQTTS